MLGIDMTQNEDSQLAQVEAPEVEEAPINQEAEANKSVNADTKNEGAAPSESVSNDGGDLQKIIAKKSYEAREAKREAEETKQRLAELEAKLAPPEPSMPEMPEYWDFENESDYKKAVHEYTKKVAEAQAFEAQKTAEQQRVQAAEQEAQLARQEQINKKVQSYADKAKRFGISTQELQQNGNLIAAYGLREDIAEVILDDESGPLIAKHIAANPQAIEVLNASNWQNGAIVFQQIKEQASALKPKVSNAPDPVETLEGGSIPPEDNPWGATFE